MKIPTLDRFVSRLYILKFVKARPATVLNLVDRLREHGIDKNIRSLRPILRSLMIARAITAELVEGSGRVYCITEQGRAELDAYLAHLDILQSERGNEPAPGQGREGGREDDGAEGREGGRGTGG